MSGQDNVPRASMIDHPYYPFGLSPLNKLYWGKLVSSVNVNIPYLLALTLSIICPFVTAYHLL